MNNNDDLPQRFSGQLDLPPPMESMRFETDPEILHRILTALINLPATTEQ